MTVVALVAVAALVACVLGLSGVLRSLIRQHARERALLIDQVCHLAGKTWTSPPSDEPIAVLTDEPDRYVFSPSQLPDDEL